MSEFDDVAKRVREGVVPSPRVFDDIAKTMRRAKAEEAGFASTMYEALGEQIQAFQSGLKENEETAVCLAHFGSTISLAVERIGYRHPHLIVLDGLDEDGHHRQLVQHVSQVSLLFQARAVPQGRKPRRIGFSSGSDANER